MKRYELDNLFREGLIAFIAFSRRSAHFVRQRYPGSSCITRHPFARESAKLEVYD